MLAGGFDVGPHRRTYIVEGVEGERVGEKGDEEEGGEGERDDEGGQEGCRVAVVGHGRVG